MYADISRSSFARGKNYSAVWAQQGRVQLDADLNEQTAIVLDWLRTFALDFVGPFGGHVTRAGFCLRYDSDGDDLIIDPGHYYVHGLRCSVADTDREGRRLTYRSHYQTPTGAPPLPRPPFLAYLVAWEQAVTARTDPDLLEPALGPEACETAVRSQVDWKIELWTTVAEFEHLGTDVEAIAAEFEAINSAEQPLMRAAVGRTEPERDDDDFFDDAYDPTEGSAGRGGRYSGPENQLYRIEVHAGRTSRAAQPTIKWSRDNGSAEFGIAGLSTEADDDRHADDAHTVVTLAELGAPGRPRLEVGDTVEVVDDNWAPRGAPHPLLRVHSVDPEAHQVTLDGPVVSTPRLRPFLRRWDQPDTGPDGAPWTDGIPLTREDMRLELEDGVVVDFSGGLHLYERGDYWLVPARTATADVLWPRDAEGRPLAAAPHGPPRYVAPLALVRGREDVVDLRTLFTHLAWPVP